MKKLSLLCASLFAVALFAVSPAWAIRLLWVGPNGNDANSCFVTAPCATFQGAINKGSVVQINCLSSGDYGAFTVIASITIDCGAGNVGNVNVTSGSAITISNGPPATIILRHLAVDGLELASIGIDASAFSSGTLIVEDSMVHGFPNGAGIVFEPSSGRGLLQVSNSQFFDNGNGIVVFPLGGQIASVTLNKIELVANGINGLVFQGGVVAGTMRDSVVGENGTNGVVADASQVFFTVEESSIVDNLSNGILTDTAGSNVTVTASTITGNGTGVKATLGTIVSSGNNTVNENASDGAFTSTKSLR
jgi:hypothetical protein